MQHADAAPHACLCSGWPGGTLQDLVLDNVELKLLQREEAQSHGGDVEMPVRAGLEVDSKG